MSIPTLLRALVALVLFSLAGCSTGHTPDYHGAIPVAAILATPRPAGGGAAVVDPRSATPTASQAVAAALGIIKELTADKFPHRAGNVLEWRSVPGLTDPAMWRVRLELDGGTWSSIGLTGEPRKPAQSWRWALQARPKMATDAAFATVAEGTRQTPEGDWEAQRGSGTLRVDFRAACAFLGESACTAAHALSGTVVDAAFTLSGDGRTLALDVSELLNGGAVVRAVALQGSIDASGAGVLKVTERLEYAASVPWSGVPTVRRMRWDARGAGRQSVVSTWIASTDSWGMARNEMCWDAGGVVTYSEEFGSPGVSGPYVGDASACGEFSQVAPLP